MHHTPLIATIVLGLVAAFVFGAIAQRMRISPLIGYLVAGIVVGPFTPGVVADSNLANELAELGVILLMFGVGLHFSLKDLLSVRRVAIPGAIGQIAVATLMGMGLSAVMGWGLFAGFIFGLALSVASTVVLLRALQSHDLVQTERGRIAVGWLIVEDLVMVLALVLLPVLAKVMDGADGGVAALARPIAMTLLKVAGFIALMLLVGRRLIPWILHWVVHTGSRELFRLAVLAIALGVAFGAAAVFDVSFALGAFFAGMILGETPLSRQATEETLPLRDAFAVLFFVSVGMLFNPAVVIEQPLPLLATALIIIIGKSIAAFLIVRSFGHRGPTALTIAASLAQIGEFSFILASLGTGLGVLPAAARDLILAGAIVSIFVNPFIFSRIAGRNGEAADEAAMPAVSDVPHVILVGYGRIGSRVSRRLLDRGRRFTVIEDQADVAARAEAEGVTVVRGSAIDRRTLEKAGISHADRMLIAISGGYEAGAVFDHAHALKPDLAIIAHAHSDEQAAYLESLGASEVIMGEREVAARMLALV